MPLVSGKKAKTKEGISENISREKHAHPDMDTKQAVAIAYSQAGKSKSMNKSNEEYHCSGCTCGDQFAGDHHKKILEVLKKKGSKQEI